VNLDAIDWAALGRGILWVFGLSISLAALSHVRWAAKRTGVPLRSAIGWDSFLAPFFAGLVLFAIGLALGASHLWEQIAWAVLALLFAWQVAAAIRGAGRTEPAPDVSAKEENAHETSQ
jgi:hypothetical protein